MAKVGSPKPTLGYQRKKSDIYIFFFKTFKKSFLLYKPFILKLFYGKLFFFQIFFSDFFFRFFPLVPQGRFLVLIKNLPWGTGGKMKKKSNKKNISKHQKWSLVHMYFELNWPHAQVPNTKIEFWGGLISDLEHCAMRALEFIRNYVTFKLHYDFSYHMKTPNLRDTSWETTYLFTYGYLPFFSSESALPSLQIVQ